MQLFLVAAGAVLLLAVGDRSCNNLLRRSRSRVFRDVT